MMKKLFLIALTGILLASCAKEQTAEQKKQEEANLMETSRKWSKSFSTEAYYSFIAKDGVMMAPDNGLMKGPKAIKEGLQKFLSVPGFKVTWEPQEVFVAKSGDLGYTIDKMLVNYDDENGNTVNQFEKVVSIWKKDKKGEWKMAIDIWNSDPTIKSIYK